MAAKKERFPGSMIQTTSTRRSAKKKKTTSTPKNKPRKGEPSKAVMHRRYLQHLLGLRGLAREFNRLTGKSNKF